MTLEKKVLDEPKEKIHRDEVWHVDRMCIGYTNTLSHGLVKMVRFWEGNDQVTILLTDEMSAALTEALDSVTRERMT